MSSQTVFVNGASGFNATWEIQTSLQKGYDVVATVPSHNKGVFLASLFGPTYGDRFGYIVTPRSRRSSTDSETSTSSLETTAYESDLRATRGRQPWVKPSLGMTPVSVSTPILS